MSDPAINELCRRGVIILRFKKASLPPKWRGICGLTLVIGCSNADVPSDLIPTDASAAGEPAPRDSGWGWTAPAGDSATNAPTYYAVYYELLLPSCGLVFCHASDGYFTLATPELGYETLVNAPASSYECSGTGMMRVKPGSPETSLLYLKLVAPPCGRLMPLQIGGSIPLEAPKIEQVRTWIERGAKADR